MPADSNKSITILAVEDSDDDLELLRESLEMNSERGQLALLTAKNLSEALVQILAIQVDAILLDLSLPDSSGLESFRAIAQATSTIPIIILTGLDDQELSLRAVQLGAQDYLRKGVDGRVILQSVRYAIERKNLERLKQEFVATVSHELKTPLAAMSGALDLLEHGGERLQAPSQSGQLFGILDRNLKRLRQLIDDILDQRSLEAGGIQFDPRRIVIGKLMPDLIEEQMPFAERYGIQLELEAIDPGLAVRADPLRFAQIVNNLLSNAIKYTRPDSVIRIRCRTQGKLACFEFHDQGVGIPEEHRDKVFQKLTRIAETNPNEREGTGLGLSITRELVEQMDGRIDFSSTPGEGSCFWFALPAIDPTADSDDERRAVALHLENDADINALVAAALKDIAHVEAAATIGAGMRFMNQNIVDLVILDINLDGESGLEFLSYIEGQRHKPPVLIFSGSTVDYPANQSRIQYLPKQNSDLRAIREAALRTLDSAPPAKAPSPRKNRPPAPAQNAVPGARDASILVVDDSADLQFIVSSFLTAAGYSAPHIASSGLEALEALTKIRPRLILLDIMMPGMSGIELYHEIRRLPEHAQLPIAFMTARGQTGNANELIEMGARAVFAKPFQREEFIATVAELLRETTAAAPTAVPSNASDGTPNEDDEFSRMRAGYTERLSGRVQSAAQDALRFLESGSEQAGQAARKAYHQIAGTAGSYGFEAIGETAGELDDLLIPVLDGDASLTDDDRATLRRLIETLDARLQELSK